MKRFIMGARVTITDIARQAGVSPSVVSTALGGANGATRVSAATRARIRQLAEQAGYRPSEHARAMRRSRQPVGFVSWRLDNAYENDIKRRVQTRLAADGHDLALLTYPGGEVGPLVDWLAGFHLSAVILFDLWRGLTPDERARLCRCHGRALVMQAPEPGEDRSLPATHCDIDVERVFADVFAHAWACGRRRVAALVTRPDSPSPRVRALQALAARHPDRIDAGRDVIGIEDGDLAGTYARVRALAEARSHDAIFTHHDQLAPVVYKAVADAGLRLGSDLAVIGMDDLPQSAYLMPTLTTVRIEREAFAAASAAWLAGADAAVTVPHALIVRESCR